jgi:hypothetical protein
METITFTPEKLVAFKTAHKACTGESFWFEDNQFLKKYAGYLIEYLEMKFNPKVKTGE